MQIRDVHRVTQRELAAVFGLDPRTIRNWDALDCPRNADRSYDLPQVIRWRLVVEAGRAESAELAGSDDALRRYREARARLCELDVEERERELIPAPFVRRGVANVIETFKRGLLGQPTKLACSLASLDRPEDVSQELEREHRELLEDLRRGMLDIIAAGPQDEQQEDSDNGRDA